MDSHNLFLQDGCLTPWAMQKYLNSSLSGDDLTRVDDHLGKCALCRESVKGFKQYSSPEGYSKQRKTLRNSYYRRRKQHTEVKFLSGSFSKFLVLVLVLIILLFIYMTLLR